MNNLFYIIISLSLILCTGCGSVNGPEKIEDFTLIVDFEPAIFMTGRCVIERHKGLNTISLDFIYGNKYKRPPDWATTKPIDPNTFTTNLPIFAYGDTLLIDSIETRKFEDDQIIKFRKSILTDLSKQKDKNPNFITIDGYQVYFTYKTDSTKNSFTFSSIQYEDVPEAKILRSVIDLMDSTFKSEIAKIYIKSWKEGFGFYYPPDKSN